VLLYFRLNKKNPSKMDPTSIQPKENVDWKQQNASCVTVDEFHVMMKEAEVKEKQNKKEIYELIGALDDKPMDVGNKGKLSHHFLNIGNFPFVLLYLFNAGI
jgi:hypothetical protein